jgi:hypothetical protein
MGIRRDHREDEQVVAAFERVTQEAGAIDYSRQQRVGRL